MEIQDISLVSQDTTLFDDTIRNNIAYANLDASEQEIIEAAKLSHCEEFINELPNKYKTIIKDNVFVGSDSQLIAPIVVEEGVTIAAGSTITDNSDKDSLLIARSRQQEKKNWKK